MEINMTNRTKMTLFYFLAIMPFVPLYYVSYNFHAWSKISEIARIILIVFFVARMIRRHKKPSAPLTLAMVYFLGCFISTYWAGISYTPLSDGGLYLFGMTLLVEDGVTTDVDAMIDGMLLYFEIVIYANLLYYLLYSFGCLAHSGYVDHYHSILGNHDAVIRRIFPGLILGGIKAFRTKNKITPRFACLCLVLIFYLLHVRAMTGVMGLLVFASAILWHEFTQGSGIFKYEYFAILSGLISIQFAVLRRFSFARFFITKILRKSMTLSGRTRIWRKILNVIPKRPFLGFGQLKPKYAIKILGAYGPHNILLGTLFYGGILGLIILILILAVYGRKIYNDRKKGSRLIFIFEAGLCAIFVMWNFERFAPVYEFYRAYVIFVMAYYCEEFEKDMIAL